jgi:hypothetical protein
MLRHWVIASALSPNCTIFVHFIANTNVRQLSRKTVLLGEYYGYEHPRLDPLV